MVQFLVTQAPKRKYSDIYSTCVMIVEAVSAREAIKKAETQDEFKPFSDYTKTKAEPLVVGTVYRF